MSDGTWKGGGKYDPELNAVLASTLADAVLIVIQSGNRGSGFAFGTTNPAYEALIPQVLRAVADDIETAQRARGGSGH